MESIPHTPLTDTSINMDPRLRYTIPDQNISDIQLPLLQSPDGTLKKTPQDKTALSPYVAEASQRLEKKESITLREIPV
ncbi:hypothetical protein BC938DRAFT_472814 [Jimgerdemannia flammicorona]|uniref:Uncharacterized protein n=1 Tax=Jimgerdemannia flammicorona TaxID=994334 RepID=A0A433QTS3_9FUNG|nr:hypothetical protein BC938DRAFT_472814 [Jimgerdemannia flammicorona]